MDPIVRPADVWGVDLLRGGRYDQYQFDHSLGGAISGSAVLRGRQPGEAPAHIPVVPLSADLNYAWQRGGDVTTTVNSEDPTSKALDGIYLPELMPDTDPCLPPLDADLCDGPSLEERCADLEDPVIPTRRQLAEQALDAAGVSLVIIPGPAIGPIDTLVPADYTAEGKTPMAVFRDMLLRADPRWWIDPGVITVDGRALPEALLEPPASPMTTPAPLWEDEAVNAGQVAVQYTPDPKPLEPPLLEDYTKECGEDPDDCDQTFETMKNGTLTWTENSGSGWGYVETTYTLVKANGQITSETRTVRKNQFRLTGAMWPLDVAELYLVVVEHSEKTNTYSPCCPEALTHSIEQTWVPFWNRTAEWDPNNPYIYLATYKEISQRWHAEGWLRQRTEVDGTLHAWTNVGESGAVPWYKTKIRVETYVPIGGGIWNIDTRINDTLIVPVREDGEIIDANDTLITNAYTVMTDAAPPSVSCDINPCDPDEDCTEKQTRKWQEAYDQYLEELDVEVAWRLNHPERRLTQVFGIERIAAVSIGDQINTTRGPAIVTRVSWNGAGARDQAGDSISVEAWSALPAIEGDE